MISFHSPQFHEKIMKKYGRTVRKSYFPDLFFKQHCKSSGPLKNQIFTRTILDFRSILIFKNLSLNSPKGKQYKSWFIPLKLNVFGLKPCEHTHERSIYLSVEPGKRKPQNLRSRLISPKLKSYKLILPRQYTSGFAGLKLKHITLIDNIFTTFNFQLSNNITPDPIAFKLPYPCCSVASSTFPKFELFELKFFRNYDRIPISNMGNRTQALPSHNDVFLKESNLFFKRSSLPAVKETIFQKVEHSAGSQVFFPIPFLVSGGLSHKNKSEAPGNFDSKKPGIVIREKQDPVKRKKEQAQRREKQAHIELFDSIFLESITGNLKQKESYQIQKNSVEVPDFPDLINTSLTLPGNSVIRDMSFFSPVHFWIRNFLEKNALFLYRESSADLESTEMGMSIINEQKTGEFRFSKKERIQPLSAGKMFSVKREIAGKKTHERLLKNLFTFKKVFLQGDMSGFLEIYFRKALGLFALMGNPLSFGKNENLNAAAENRESASTLWNHKIKRGLGYNISEKIFTTHFTNAFQQYPEANNEIRAGVYENILIPPITIQTEKLKSVLIQSPLKLNYLRNAETKSSKHTVTRAFDWLTVFTKNTLAVSQFNRHVSHTSGSTKLLQLNKQETHKPKNSISTSYFNSIIKPSKILIYVFKSLRILLVGNKLTHTRGTYTISSPKNIIQEKSYHYLGALLRKTFKLSQTQMFLSIAAVEEENSAYLQKIPVLEEYKSAAAYMPKQLAAQVSSFTIVRRFKNFVALKSNRIKEYIFNRKAIYSARIKKAYFHSQSILRALSYEINRIFSDMLIHTAVPKFSTKVIFTTDHPKVDCYLSDHQENNYATNNQKEGTKKELKDEWRPTKINKSQNKFNKRIPLFKNQIFLLKNKEIYLNFLEIITHRLKRTEALLCIYKINSFQKAGSVADSPINLSIPAFAVNARSLKIYNETLRKIKKLKFQNQYFLSREAQNLLFRGNRDFSFPEERNFLFRECIPVTGPGIVITGFRTVGGLLELLIRPLNPKSLKREIWIGKKTVERILLRKYSDSERSKTTWEKKDLEIRRKKQAQTGLFDFGYLVSIPDYLKQKDSSQILANKVKVPAFPDLINISRALLGPRVFQNTRFFSSVRLPIISFLDKNAFFRYHESSAGTEITGAGLNIIYAQKTGASPSYKNGSIKSLLVGEIFSVKKEITETKSSGYTETHAFNCLTALTKNIITVSQFNPRISHTSRNTKILQLNKQETHEAENSTCASCFDVVIKQASRTLIPVFKGLEIVLAGNKRIHIATTYSTNSSENITQKNIYHFLYFLLRKTFKLPEVPTSFSTGKIGAGNLIHLQKLSVTRNYNDTVTHTPEQLTVQVLGFITARIFTKLVALKPGKIKERILNYKAIYSAGVEKASSHLHFVSRALSYAGIHTFSGIYRSLKVLKSTGKVNHLTEYLRAASYLSGPCAADIYIADTQNVDNIRELRELKRRRDYSITESKLQSTINQPVFLKSPETSTYGSRKARALLYNNKNSFTSNKTISPILGLHEACIFSSHQALQLYFTLAYAGVHPATGEFDYPAAYTQKYYTFPFYYKKFSSLNFFINRLLNPKTKTTNYLTINDYIQKKTRNLSAILNKDQLEKRAGLALSSLFLLFPETGTSTPLPRKHMLEYLKIIFSPSDFTILSKVQKLIMGSKLSLNRLLPDKSFDPSLTSLSETCDPASEKKIIPLSGIPLFNLSMYTSVRNSQNPIFAGKSWTQLKTKIGGLNRGKLEHKIISFSHLNEKQKLTEQEILFRKTARICLCCGGEKKENSDIGNFLLRSSLNPPEKSSQKVNNMITPTKSRTLQGIFSGESFSAKADFIPENKWKNFISTFTPGKKQEKRKNIPERFLFEFKNFRNPNKTAMSNMFHGPQNTYFAHMRAGTDKKYGFDASGTSRKESSDLVHSVGNMHKTGREDLVYGTQQALLDEVEKIGKIAFETKEAVGDHLESHLHQAAGKAGQVIGIEYISEKIMQMIHNRLKIEVERRGIF